MGLRMAGGDAVNALQSCIRESKDRENGFSTYSEGLQVIDAEGISVEVEQSILQHATVAVAGKAIG